MRPRKLVAGASLAAVLTGLLVALAWLSSSPLELKVLKMERCDVYDDNGTQLWLATLAVSNPNAQYLELEKDWVSVEARVANRWIDVKNLCPPLNLWTPRTLVPRAHREMHLILPAGTEMCRLRANFQGELFRSRFARLLGVRGRSIVSKSPAMSKWLWGNAYWPQSFRSPPHWKQTTLEATVWQAPFDKYERAN
jgi:hypothetical protein